MRRGRRASLRRVGSPPSTHTVCLVSPQAPVTQPLGTRPRAAPHTRLLACWLNWSLSNPSGRHARLKSITARRRRQVATAAQGGFAAPRGLQRPQGRGDGGSAPPRSRLRPTRQNDRTPVARSDSEALAAPKDQPALRGDNVTCETVTGPPAATPREDTPLEHASERGGATELGPRGRGRPCPCPRAAGTGQAACTAGRRARRPRHTPSRGSPRSENAASSVPSSRFLSLLPLEDALVLSGGRKSPCLGRSVVIYEDHCSTHSSSETTFWERSVICKEIRDFQPNQGEGPFLASISLRSPRPWGGKLTPLPRGLQNGKANFCWHLPTTSGLGVARAGSQP